MNETEHGQTVAPQMVQPTPHQGQSNVNCCDAVTLATCCSAQAKTTGCCAPAEDAAAEEPSACGCR